MSINLLTKSNNVNLGNSLFKIQPEDRKATFLRNPDNHTPHDTVL